MSWNESEPKRVDVGGARVYITVDANYQWDSVTLDITNGTDAFNICGDARQAQELAKAISEAADAALAKRREMMKEPSEEPE